MDIRVKIGNSWSTSVKDVRMKISSTWTQVKQGWIKVNGIWQQFYSYLSSPTNTVAPSLTNSGTSMSVTSGTWSGSPTSYIYTWYQTGSGSPVRTFGPTVNTSDSYTGSYSNTYYVSVTATNGGGSTSANSNSLYISLPQLSTPSNLRPYEDNPTVGTNNFQATWDAVSGATTYTWTIKRTSDNFVLGGPTTTTGQYTQTTTVTSGTQITVTVVAKASGYLDSAAAILTYTTALTPTAPTSASSYASGVGTLTIPGISGGGPNYLDRRYEYDTLFSYPNEPFSYTSAKTSTSTLTITGLNQGSPYDIYIYGYSTGYAAGLQYDYKSSTGFLTLKYAPTLATSAPASAPVTSTFSSSLNAAKNTYTYTYQPTSIPTRTSFFYIGAYEHIWNGSSWVNVGFTANGDHYISGKTTNFAPTPTANMSSSLTVKPSIGYGGSSYYYYDLYAYVYNFDSSGNVSFSGGRYIQTFYTY